MTFAVKLAEHARVIDARLAELLAAPFSDGIPERLLDAMRHAVLGSGKRFRPCLVIESAALFGVAPEKSRDCAAALEFIHCYSLVHDDLPAMDDDDMRRGQPTVHRAFDEWTAILAGDGLQALAFDVLAQPSTHQDPCRRVALTALLARAAGPRGMVGGQSLDLDADKRGIVHGARDVERLQAMKTGALIAAACEAGAILGGATESEREALARFGRELGLAFQMADDVLDVIGDAALIGKGTTKDAARGKATQVSLIGLDAARAAMAEVEERAREALRPFGVRAEILAGAAAYVTGRNR